MAEQAGGIRAGRAFVELALNDNKLLRGLKAAAAKLKAFGSQVMGIGSRLIAGSSVLAVPLLGAVKHFAELGDQLEKTSIRTGIGVEALSELKHAAEASDVTFEELQTALVGMKKAIESGLELPGETVEEKFLAAAQVISMFDNEIDRANAAMAIFGKSGVTLLPMLADGAEGIRALREEAREFGLTVTTEQAKAAATFGDTWALAVKSVKSAFFEIGAALAPVLTQIIQAILPVIKAIGAWVRENSSLAITIAGVIAGAFALGTAVVALGAIIWGVGTILSVVTGLFSALGSAISLLLSPLGLIAAAIAGVVVAWATMTESGKKTVSHLIPEFQSLGEEFHEVWEGIKAAVQSGQLELAFEIVTQTIKRLWLGTLAALIKAWNDFIRTITTWLKNNPWIFVVAGGAIGGLAAGPWGAIGGAFVGFGAGVFVDDIADAIERGAMLNAGAAEAKLREAQNRMQALVQQAKAELERKKKEWPEKPPIKDTLPTRQQIVQSLVGAKGAFAVSFARGQFALGDQIKRQEEILDKINRNVEKIREDVRDGLKMK